MWAKCGQVWRARLREFGAAAVVVIGYLELNVGYHGPPDSVSHPHCRHATEPLHLLPPHGDNGHVVDSPLVSRQGWCGEAPLSRSTIYRTIERQNLAAMSSRA